MHIWRKFGGTLARGAVMSVLFGTLIHNTVIQDANGQFYNNYRSLAEYESRMDQLIADHPTLASPITIGTSVEGREIRGMRITGTGSNSVAKKAVVFHGLIHAREWISGMVTMFGAENLLEGYATDARVRNVMDNVEFLVVPVLNPDGYEYSRNVNRNWRKNRRNNGNGSFGVDLNRNFGFEWGGPGSSGNTNSGVYRGPSPFSEPEAQALRDLFLDNQHIVSHIDYHSFGEIIAGPWGYTFTNPPRVDILDGVAEIMSDSIFAVNGHRYLFGDDTNVLGLAAGITNDWAFGDQGVYSYTIELRPTSFNPGFELPANQIVPTAEENFPAILDLAEFTIAVAGGDFNFDQTFSCADVDELVQSIVDGTNRAEFDVTGDGMVNVEDLDEWLARAGAANLPSGASYLPADANLDGTVDAVDFTLWNDHKFTANASFCSGDFNADGVVDAVDFTIWNDHKFTSADSVAVPEPTTFFAGVMFAVGVLARHRRTLG